MASVNWSGVFPAVTTTFRDDGAIDAALTQKHIAWLMAEGCDGVIVSGSLGEGSTLDADEKVELVSIARAGAGARPVILTIADGATRRAADLARRAKAAGADGLMVLPPMMYNASSEETCRFFEAVADASDLPIMIYNNPVSYKIDVTVPMLERLARHPHVAAVKESSDDVRRITTVRNALGDRLKIFTGVDNLGMESALMGADGWVAGLVDAFPAETAAVWHLAKAGRIAEALAIYRWFVPLLELDVSPRLVQNIKLAQVMVGIGNENVRAPRLPLTGEERAKVEAIVRTALEKRPALPSFSKAA